MLDESTDRKLKIMKTNPLWKKSEEWLFFRVNLLEGDRKEDSKSTDSFLCLKLGVHFMTVLTCKNSSSLTQQTQKLLRQNKVFKSKSRGILKWVWIPGDH